jgi:hypothetical protein
LTDPWLLNCNNGALDLRTGELRAHRREDLLTKLAPVAFDRAAIAPRWSCPMALPSAYEVPVTAPASFITVPNAALKLAVYGKLLRQRENRPPEPAILISLPVAPQWAIRTGSQV